MAEVLKLRLGADVFYEDDHVGVLSRFIIEPVGHVVSHLDVASRHGTGRLVPIGEVGASDDAVHLSRAPEYLAEPDLDATVTIEPSPVLRLDQVSLFPTLNGVGLMTFTGAPYNVVTERVPDGDLDLRQGARAFATDGHVGHVDGLVVTPGDGLATHLLLGEEHLFGAREAATPVAAVTGVGSDAVALSLSKSEIEQLPRLPA
jgi:hypothetical protein